MPHQSHHSPTCPSHPKVPRGLWDVLRTPMSHQRHHSPTVLPIPKSRGDCGMSSGLSCPIRDITVPLSFPSQSPKGTVGFPRDSCVPSETSQSHCPSHPKVPRGLWDFLGTPVSHQRHHSPTVLPIPKSQGDSGMSSGLSCPIRDITVPLSFPSQSPKGTVGFPRDSCVPSETSQSHCPSHPKVPRGLWDFLETPVSHQRHHSPTVLPIPKSRGDCGMSSGLSCPIRDITVPLSFLSQSPKGTVGFPRDSCVPSETSQSHCPSHPKVPRGQWDVLGTLVSHQRHHSPTVLPIPKSQGDCGISSGLLCPIRDITVPLSFPSQSPEGTVGFPRDSRVPSETSQSHCPSHPKVPRGQWDFLGTLMSHQRHHSPTVLPIPKSRGDCGISSGLSCPIRDITVPLSFPSQSPEGTVGFPRDSRVPSETSQSHCPSHPKVPRGLWDVLGTPVSHQRHHSPTVLPIPKSQGDSGISSGLSCPIRDITVPLSFPSQSPEGTVGFPRDSRVPSETSQSHCPSHPKVPRGLWDFLGTPVSHQRYHSPTVLPIPKYRGDCGISSRLPCPIRDITVPLSFPSQSPKGTVGCPRDSRVPSETSQSHCPSHPKVPRGLWDFLGTPVSHHRHHSPTVLPIPKSRGDCGISSGLSCPIRDITVPLSFPSQSAEGTLGCPRDSRVPSETSQSHCPSHPKVPRGQWDFLGTLVSHQRHHSPTVLPIPKSRGDCGISSGLSCPIRDITVPLSFPSQSPEGTVGFPRDSRVPSEISQSHCPSHPKVPRGLWDVLGTLVSHQRHHSPTVLPIPKCRGDFGMSSGLPCPIRDITVPLSFPSQSPLGKSLGILPHNNIKQAVVNHRLIA